MTLDYTNPEDRNNIYFSIVLNYSFLLNCNEHNYADIFQNLDGAIVLLLGRVPTLHSSIQEWVKWKAQQCLRTRTSTWSSYTANTKEKLQVQRPR